MEIREESTRRFIVEMNEDEAAALVTMIGAYGGTDPTDPLFDYLSSAIPDYTGRFTVKRPESGSHLAPRLKRVGST